MRMIKPNLPTLQRGSFYVTGIMLLLLGGALTIVLKLAPSYTGNATLKNSMATISARSDYKDLGLEEVRNELLKSLRVNAIEGFDAKNIKFTHENGKDYVDINYEVRVPMAYNVSAIVEFKNRFPK